MDYLKIFNSETSYNAAKSNFTYPTVAYIENLNTGTDEIYDVRYMNTPKHDYSQDYLTFVALEDGTFTLHISDYANSFGSVTVAYRLYDGSDWTSWRSASKSGTNKTDLTTTLVKRGQKVQWRGNITSVLPKIYGSYGSLEGSYFESTGRFNICGRLSSMAYGDNYLNNNSIPQANQSAEFAGLFSPSSSYGYSGDGIKVVDASNLKMFDDVSESCYSFMFRNCTTLVAAPQLPATTMERYSYRHMFEGCINLTTAPDLPSSFLNTDCYSGMFYGCSSLNYIKALFITPPSNDYTNNWVSGVAATGTFVKSEAATWNVVGNNGIPNGWVVGEEDADYSKHYLTFVPEESGTFTLTIPQEVDTNFMTEISYSINGGTWTTTNVDNTNQTITTPTVSQGDFVMWKGEGISMGGQQNSYQFYSTFSSTCEFNVRGNIMSLLYSDDFENNTTLNADKSFGYLFDGATKLIDASDLILPATSVPSYGYTFMFKNCSGLVAVPTLPATTLNTYSYSGMFQGCTGLVNVPTNLLPATGNLPQSCYASMFKGCTSLVNAPNLPGLMYSRYCYSNMFEDCTSLTTPPTQLNGYSIYQGTGFSYGCCKQMFKNCTSLTTSPYISVTENQNSSFDQYSSPMEEMFYGCSSLTQISIAAKYWRGTPAKNWVVGVAANGTFIKSSSLSESTIGRGVNGIPEGWTVQ